LPVRTNKGTRAMAEYTTDRLRTVAVVGHGAAGKTTLIE
jgi:translation elongation factor EF-G